MGRSEKAESIRAGASLGARAATPASPWAERGCFPPGTMGGQEGRNSLMGQVRGDESLLNV